MREGSHGGILSSLLALLLVLDGTVVSGSLAWSQYPECSGFRQGDIDGRFPGLHWTPAYVGLKLEHGDAVMVCESATLVLRAAEPVSSTIRWTADASGYIGTVESQTIVAFKRPGIPTMPSATAVLIGGTVLYARDPMIIGLDTFPVAVRLDPPGARELLARLEQLRESLPRQPNRILVGGEDVRAWDLVWTGPNGRFEIEISKRGPRFRYDKTTDVFESGGAPTDRKRFVEDSFFVLNPAYFEAGRITWVVGDVFLISDSDFVRAMLPSPGMVYHLWGGGLEHQRWRDVLRQSELHR